MVSPLRVVPVEGTQPPPKNPSARKPPQEREY